jgi:glycosyltransferase involved in cell wall biosynthesis
MRILYLHMFDLGYGWGGSASVLRSLHGALSRLGHVVEVTSARAPDPFGWTVCDLPFDVRLTFGPEKRDGETAIDEIPTGVLADMAARAAEKVERELFARGAPDLLVVNHINLMALVAWHLWRRHGVPYRILSHGTDTKLLLRSARYRALFEAAARGADRIFTISTYVAREVETTVGGSVEVIGGAVDEHLFFPPPAPRCRDGEVAFIGRLVSEKGLWPLLEAFERQRAARSLVLIGEGPLQEDIAAHLRLSPIRDRVRLRGYVPPEELREALAGASLVVLPSIWPEPLGLVALEALACGLPVIASDIGGIPEVIVHGVNGALVPHGDADELARALDRVLGDDAMYERLRQGVRTLPVPTYRDVARRLVAPIHRAAGGVRPTRPAEI